MAMDETAKRRSDESAKRPIRYFRDLDAYQNPLGMGLRVYELSKKFLAEELRRTAGMARQGGFANSSIRRFPILSN